LDQLSASLKNNTPKYTDKAIKSVRTKVVNIYEYLDSNLTMDQFSDYLFHQIIHPIDGAFVAPLDKGESMQISRLSKEKFETWDWIYGYSPKYQFKTCIDYLDIRVEIELYIEKGIIINSLINTDPVGSELGKALNQLVNVRHDYQSIFSHLADREFMHKFSQSDIAEFCYLLF
jgi:lipoate---protein ligase